MGVKVHKRGSATINTIFFIIISIFFYHIILSLGRGVTAFNLFSFKNYLFDNKLLVALAIASNVLVYYAARFSKIVFALFLALAVFNNLIVYFESFDKVVLVFCFIYVLSAIYFFALWQQELEIVVYWPGYAKQDIGQKSSYTIYATISQINDASKSAECHLTNWGECECFLRYKNERDFSSIKGNIILTIDFVNHKFKEYGQITTSYDGGVGIRFIDDGKSFERGTNRWRDFFTIISHRGYNPRSVRV